MKISEQLKNGEIYTRKELKQQFSIKAKSIDNGVFSLKDQRCIWLFITEDKRDHLSEYTDALKGDDLYMDGQNQGGTDKSLVGHAANEYEGKFQYVTHRGTKPAHFHFRRVKD
jgi:6-phosphogluconate dehydrogenase (decarboxylating)